ncbi:hypothetical protein J3A83DRAFT_4082240, partial [Scleroderma citrinum]
IYHHPESFLGTDQWIWANSVYLPLPWCVVPFKQLSTVSMPQMQKIFNQHVFKVSYLMQFQIQNQQDLDFTNMWMHCCLILHNMILEIEEDLGLVSSNTAFME